VEGVKGPERSHSTDFNASHAARCVACQGVRSHAVPVALVGECAKPVTWSPATPARTE
jgi:hypothetical protein